MTNIKDILIIGDSFATDRDPNNSWLGVLNKCFMANLRGAGYPGNSFWPVRNLFHEEISQKVPDLLILCHTSYSRYPCKDNKFGGYRSGDKVFKTWYENYFNFDFHLWANFKWYEELDNALTTYNIPYVIHFFCFEEDTINYKFKNGITSVEDLYSIQKICEKLHSCDPCLTHNHFCYEDNIKIGKKLHEKINHIEPYLNGYIIDFEFRKIYEK